MIFNVPIVKQQHVRGVIAVEAGSSQQARRQVERMIQDMCNPLQVNDWRITWGDPVYLDFSFAVDSYANDDDEREETCG
jgi:hypothetical protein